MAFYFRTGTCSSVSQTLYYGYHLIYHSKAKLSFSEDNLKCQDSAKPVKAVEKIPIYVNSFRKSHILVHVKASFLGRLL